MTTWWKNRKAKKEHEEAQMAYDRAFSVWTDDMTHVSDLLELAMNLDEFREEFRDADVNIRLKSDETVLLVGAGVGLIEPRVTAGHYEGGSSGVSIRVAKGVRYRVGQHKGVYVRGPEEQKVIDEGGTVYVTDKRVLYSSPNRNREWAFDKLIDVHNEDFGGIQATLMSVTNRQKTSGIAYPRTASRTVQDRIALALAIYDDEVHTLISSLQEEQRELELSKPQAPPALALD